MNDWVTPWAMYGWGVLFLAVLIFELVTIAFNNTERGKGKRANLTAYVRAFFGIGERRLKYSMPRWILIGFMVWLLLHFLEIAP